MNEVVATGDRDLWAAAVGGDADAFGALFERHSRAVYNFAFRGTADWAAAEDMASEVFLTAWRRRSQTPYIDYTDPALSQGIVGNAQLTEPNSYKASRTALVLQTGSLPYSFQQVGRASCPR